MADEKTAETPKDDEKNETGAAGVKDAAVKDEAPGAKAAETEPETAAHIKSHQDVAKAPAEGEGAAGAGGDSRREAVQRFLGSSQPQEILEAIEEQAKVLMQLIHGIPDGVQHAWHSVAAEIAKRKL